MNDLRIIVVEDSDLQRQYALSLCRSLGVTYLFEAAGGSEAITVLLEQAEKINIAIVDLEMPGMDGVSLLREIAKQSLLGSVIILSSKDPSLIASVGVMAEADGLKVLATLQKPLTIDALQQSLFAYQKPQENTHAVLDSHGFTVDDIAEGLEKEQFMLYFQPKITSQSCMLKGVEALIRWQHPTRGMVPPIMFIPLAEQGGLITELTHYVLLHAVQQQVLWRERGLNINIAINISANSLSEQNFAEQIERQLLAHKVLPKQFTLELTESAVLVDIAAAIGVLAHLRLKGFGLSIDDFGTGFSTQQQISRLPVTELKVDRAFVDGASHKSQIRAILENTLDLGHRLNLITVTEGVETAEDFKLVCDLKADLIQGYFVAKPMAGNLIPDWIATDLVKFRKNISLSS